MMASQIDREEEEIDDPNLDHEGIFLACATAGMNLSNLSKIPETSDEDIDSTAMLLDDFDEESLPSEGEDTLESVFLAVTEKRRLLGIEMETNAGRMKTIGNIPPDLGRNYILKRVTQSLQEDNDDLKRALKFDTAERKFKDRGNLWEKLVEEKGNDTEGEQALMVTETECENEVKFTIENEELKFVIPEKSTLHAMLNEEAYKMYDSLPRHKMDNYISLKAKLDKNDEIRNKLAGMNYPYVETEESIEIDINALSDSGAGLALGTPEFFQLPLTKLEDASGSLLGSTGVCDSEETKERKLVEIVGENDKLHVDVRKGHNLGYGKVTPPEVRKAIAMQIGVKNYPFRYPSKQKKIDFLVSYKQPEAQNKSLLDNTLKWAKPLLSPKSRA